MACNSCNGILFPDFVSNSCCNPCRQNQTVGGTSTGCGCGCGNVNNTGCSCGCDAYGCGCTCR